jgi:hypothetical protein
MKAFFSLLITSFTILAFTQVTLASVTRPDFESPNDVEKYKENRELLMKYAGQLVQPPLVLFRLTYQSWGDDVLLAAVSAGSGNYRVVGMLEHLPSWDWSLSFNKRNIFQRMFTNYFVGHAKRVENFLADMYEKAKAPQTEPQVIIKLVTNFKDMKVHGRNTYILRDEPVFWFEAKSLAPNQFWGYRSPVLIGPSAEYERTKVMTQNIIAQNSNSDESQKCSTPFQH